ncbi:MAG: hypothetical protein BWY21_00419 [Parcubacteria group bacterium ADurb.Bin216]|jgi:hypothetical protein|nr:MAG: hypothetical protein BWY21_00419 [Parcubacteria group bacterium ADurb.Bin216]
MKVNFIELAAQVGTEVNGKIFEPRKVRVTQYDWYLDAQGKMEEINAM